METMKYKHLLAAILPCILLLQCATHRYKVTYNIPQEYPEARRKELLTILEKGKELYKANCSDCHGIFTAGKDKVPNFTNIQLDNYSARFMRRDPKNHAVFMEMSPEQLNEVLTFLRYKKPANPDSVKAGQRRF